jgi:hypothetical protein
LLCFALLCFALLCFALPLLLPFAFCCHPSAKREDLLLACAFVLAVVLASGYAKALALGLLGPPLATKRALARGMLSFPHIQRASYKQMIPLSLFALAFAVARSFVVIP